MLARDSASPKVNGSFYDRRKGLIIEIEMLMLLRQETDFFS
jgi:hypothetical protein